MANSVLDPDYASEGSVFIPSLIQTKVGLGEEVQSSSQITFDETIRWFSGMSKAPENISDVIANRLQEIAHVKTVMMGRSGDVYHVWIMISEWSLERRKAVYAVQRELLAKLKGFDLDFYVVALEDSAKPEDLVSDIPVIFQRAA